MASLRDLRRRIKSVKSTQKITKAMELVAAAKMRRAQERVEAARPYADEITNVIADLFARNPAYKHPYLDVRDVTKRLVLLITSDRGLVGALNSNNIRLGLAGRKQTPCPPVPAPPAQGAGRRPQQPRRPSLDGRCPARHPCCHGAVRERRRRPGGSGVLALHQRGAPAGDGAPAPGGRGAREGGG